MSSILRGFLSILGAKITSLLLSLLITPILVRILGSSRYGDYAFILSVLGITMILVNTGIFDGVRKYMAEDRGEKDWKERVFGFYSRIAVILAAIASIGYGLLSQSPLISTIFGDEFRVYLYLLAGLIIARQMYSLARGGLMGIGLESRSEPLAILKKVLFGVFGISLAYLGYGVTAVLLGHIIASSIVAFVALLILSKRLDLSKAFTHIPSTFPRRELFEYNGMSVVLILLTASLYHTDILLLRSLSGSQQTGYYKAALVVAEFLWFAPNALQTVLLHSSSELWSAGRTDRISKLVSRTVRYNFSLSLLLGLGLAALAHDFIPIYFGSEFESAIKPLLILLPGAFGFALSRPIFAVGQGKGDLGRLIAATGTAAVLNLILNLFLIPRYGMIGAAAATSTSYGSMLFLHIFVARRIGFNPVKDIRIIKSIAVGILAMPVIFGAATVIDSALLSLLIVPPMGFAIYAMFTVKLGVVPPDELIPIVNQLPDPISSRVHKIIVYLE
ncbi:oligosaccharide flippase family protein [Halomicrobium urmianum]|uniref:oligosaccharide flippase family protein n=1 Tax=Halomicrobium urmianum TaxID=1586233 RepID=UPI001CD9C3B6|nr:polysaccharide biosynthesis C-terminal domain-containing protein [Halomicrobium urmianum]